MAYRKPNPKVPNDGQRSHWRICRAHPVFRNDWEHDAASSGSGPTRSLREEQQAMPYPTEAHVPAAARPSTMVTKIAASIADIFQAVGSMWF
jgi:hypothetical protein